MLAKKLRSRHQFGKMASHLHGRRRVAPPVEDAAGVNAPAPVPASDATIDASAADAKQPAAEAVPLKEPVRTSVSVAQDEDAHVGHQDNELQVVAERHEDPVLIDAFASLGVLPPELAHVVRTYAENQSLYRAGFASMRGSFNDADPGQVYCITPQLVKQVDSIFIRITWNDQGWGNLKGALQIGLQRSNQTIVHEWALRLLHHDLRRDTVLLDAASSLVVQQAQAGDRLVFRMMAGGGGGHTLAIRSAHITVAYTVSSPF